MSMRVGARPVPEPVGYAYRLMITSAVFCLLSLVIVAFTAGTLRDRLARGGTDPDSAQSYATLVVRTTALVEVAFALAFVLLAGRVLQGRGWARALTLVMCAVVLLGNVLLLVLDVSGFASVVSVLWLLITVALVLLLTSRGASPWFRRRRRVAAGPPAVPPAPPTPPGLPG